MKRKDFYIIYGQVEKKHPSWSKKQILSRVKYLIASQKDSKYVKIKT